MATTRRRREPDDAERYGFRWGQLDVIRNAEFAGSKSLSVITDHEEIQIGVSAKGHRIRVWRNGKELK